MAGKTSLCVFDLGAHDGFYSEQVKRLFPDAQVYAVEPHPESFRRLKKRAEQFHFTAIDVAIGNRSGPMELFDYNGRAGTVFASTYEKSFELLYPSVTTAGTSAWKASMTTLDDLAGRLGVERISFLKIDVEGDEIAALEGAKGLISRGAIDMIQFELSLITAFKHLSIHHYQDLLPGYKFFRVLPRGLMALEKLKKEDPELLFLAQNILAVRQDHPDAQMI